VDSMAMIGMMQYVLSKQVMLVENMKAMDTES
jgi:hypothetical protein